MNSELLLTHFNRISEAPDAIPRLRRFILDLAVGGNLAEQNPNDESVAALLVQNDQSRRAIAEKDRRADADRQALLATESKWNIPPSWNWGALADLVLFIDYRGKTPTKTERGVRLITAKNVKKGFINSSPEEFLSEPDYRSWMTRGFPKDGDVLFTTEAPMGNAAVVCMCQRFALAQRVICFRSYGAMDPYFLTLQLLAEPFQSILDKTATGLTAKGIKAAKLRRLPVAVPPLAEQLRIVAKVDELMALCDRLEATQREREIRRDRLTAASIQHLNNGESAEIFRERVNFCLNNLAGLTSRPDQIKQIRQTVLNLAVRGKLVSQDPNDEPAHQLLHRIKAEKARLLKEGLIKKLDSAELPTASEFPFAMPPGWASSTLQSLCISVTDGDHLPPPKADQGVPFLVIGNVRSQTLNFAGCRHVPEQYYKALDAIRRPQREDILYTLVGSYGIPVIVADNRPFCVQRHIGILRPSKIINVTFLSRVLESKWVFDQATAYATGIAQKTVPLAGLRRILIPLPPLAEQQRIVAKVDELMAVCDRLEKWLSDTRAECRELLEAVLHHTFHSADHVVEHQALPAEA